MQNALMFAIAGIVAIISFCVVWFGVGLVMKLQSVAHRPATQEAEEHKASS